MSIISIILLAVKSYLILFSVAAIASSAVGAHQEQKIWAPANLPSLNSVGIVKVFLFNLVWITLCAIGCVFIWIKHLLTLGKSDIVYDCNCVLERFAAIICTKLVGHVQVIGAENLPPDDGSVPAPVYIANHASQIDLAAVYYIKRHFKWIAKQSVLFIPGVGATMYTGDHVLINRVKGKNQKSVSTLFEKSNAAVQSGVPMFLFPQGTRVMGQRLPFKDGAFIIAQTNKSKLVPISLEIPLNAWNTWYPLFSSSGSQVPQVILTVHKPIEVTGEEDREVLKQQCSDIIYSCLPKIYEQEGEKGKESNNMEEPKKDK